MDAISRLIQPRSVAVIGASADPSKTAGRPVAYLQKHGYAGAIYPVNPKADAIGELKCYPDIASLPETPDVAIVLLGAERAHVAVRDLSARGCAAAIVLASGYTETGEDGARRQKQLVEAAGSMRILGPNTIGLVNLTDAIVLSATGALEMDEFPVGGIGVVSQSGGILGSLLSRAAARGIGLSKLISTSNEVDLELADFIDHLADDPATKVIALYIETVRNPARFRAACLKAARAGKPVVAFKIGRSEAGAKAAVSHTGAMAGADRMYDALFRQVGVIRANSFNDLLDVPAALATGRRLHGKRVAILTSTGGAGTLVSDDLGVAGFDTPAPDAATADALRALQTGSEAVLDRNPIDVTLAGLRPDLLRGAIRALLASPSYDALVIIVGSSSLAQPELMAGAIQDCLPETDKPVFAYVSPHAPDVAALLTRRGVPAFAAAESCTAALDGMLRVSRFAATSDAQPTPSTASSTELSAAWKGSLDEAQAKQLFASFGVPCAAERIVDTPAEAEAAARELGGRVVLKILSSQITHKSDVGGVAVGLTPQTVGERLQRMAGDVLAKAGVRPERFLVQEMVGGGTELILGMHRDGLGTAIMLGMGGVTAELFQDTTMRLLPTTGGLSRAEALAMAQELKTWPLLDGFRGRPKADVEALVDAIVAFSNMAAQLGERLVEAEINPVFVLPQGQGVRAADGVAVLARAETAMSEARVHLERDGDIAVIVIDNPPINAGSTAVRQGLMAAVQQLEADATLQGAVLIGAGNTFIAGSDLREFGQPLVEPQLPTVIAAIEACSKPVVAALHGAALGGGFELALGCDARIAAPGTVVGLPEVTLGIIPGAGGTQRLPRLVGIPRAIRMICSGERLAVPAALEAGIVDAIAEGDLRSVAVTHARALAGRKQRLRDRAVPPADATAVEEAAQAALKAGKRRPAVQAAIDAVIESARVPIDEALADERAVFQQLRVSREAFALRHQFFAERDSAKHPSIEGAVPRSVQRVAVIGAGTMGTGIAIAALEAGCDVLLLEQDRAALERGATRIHEHFAGRVQSGKVKAAAAAAVEARLQASLDWSRLAEADLVIEAVFEDLAVKRQVFERIDAHARPGAVLASNTSYLDLDAIAAATRRPQDVIGLHFFSPANVMKLLEVVRGKASAPDALATGLAFGKRLQKTTVLTGNAFGFIGNRIFSAYRRQCEFMVEEGASPDQVDAALQRFGFAMGPFAVADLSGLDIAWRMRQAQAATRDPAARYVRIPDRLCEAGRLGRKTGAGYYAYPAGAKGPQVDPAVQALIEVCRAEKSIVARAFDDAEIVRRAMLAIVNEAALLLAEGVAERATDVDVVLVNGYGFPRWEGGPVFWARDQGEAALLAGLEELARLSGPGFLRGELRHLLEEGVRA